MEPIKTTKELEIEKKILDIENDIKMLHKIIDGDSIQVERINSVLKRLVVRGFEGIESKKVEEIPTKPHTTVVRGFEQEHDKNMIDVESGK